MIQKIAAKYSYAFLDDLKQEDKQAQSVVSAAPNKPAYNIDDSNVNVWIFQANPERYDILNALADPEVLQRYTWQVNQHKERIKKGDMGLVWMSGKEAGIYGVADIVSNPEISGETAAEEVYWIDDKDKGKKILRVTLTNRILLINSPIYRHELKADERLDHLSILKMPQGTNFPVAPDEWRVIKDLINARIK
jgi:hypothetical protein